MDTCFSACACFENFGTNAAEIAVRASAIVKALDVVRDVGGREFAVHVDMSDALLLKATF